MDQVRVLMVEDTPTDAELVERELRKGGLPFTSVRVETRDGFLRALSDFAPDIVLSDYSLPQFNGLEALRLLKESGLDVPFILITGSMTEEVAVECMKQGVSDYILKTSLKRLPSAVLNVLEKVRAERARAAALEALRESEERYRAFVANSSEGIWRFELEAPLDVTLPPDEQIEHLYRHAYLAESNDAMAQMYGYARAADIIGARVERMLPRSNPRNLAYLRDFIHNGHRLVDAETVEIDRRGRERHFVNSRVGIVKDGRLLRIWGTRRDITERKLAERELDRQRAFLRQVIDTVPYFISVKDREGRFTIVNRSLAVNYGTTVEDLRGKRDADFNPRAEEVSRIRRDDLEVLDTGREKFIPEEVVTDCAGRPRCLQTIKRPLASDDGSIEQVLGVSIDITGRRRAEAERDAERRLLNALVEQLPVGVVFVDQEMRFTRANTAVGAILGIPPERLNGMAAGEVVELVQVTMPDGTPVRGADLASARAIRTGRVTEPVEQLITTPAGEARRLLVSAAPVTFEGAAPSGSVIVFTDVTEQHAVQEQLRQSQRIESVGMLAGGVAHDMNNLLTVITGYSDLLLRGVRGDESLTVKVEEIKRAGERAASLTHQLLAFSRRQVMQPRVLDLNEVITEMERMLRRLIGEDIEFNTAPDPSLWPVKADFGQLQQVVMNLVVNARDAMPDGGKLTIETSNVHLDETYASRHLPVEPGRYVMLAVSDIGTGMDAETQRRVFEPFFTTKEVGKGTGLGLSTVYGIVKQSGGYIWLYSEVGLGTTFKVYLPVAEGAAEAPAEAPRAEHDRSGVETLLLVEDEAAVRTYAREVLEAGGYRLLIAGDGEEALRVAAAHEGPIHLLVTDVVMPRMGGVALARHLAGLRPETRVLYMSGYTDDALAHRGVLSPEVAFLEKPFTPDSLYRKVREVLDARRGLDRLVA